jgi:phospholipid/cholesterol/gamma-HCH transport system substrate-binding protein
MRDKNLEIKVGSFFLLSLIAVGILVVTFGRFGQFNRSNYSITVQFANSSGVLKNSQVLYRGAKVGTVSEAPQIADGGQTVEILMKIRQDIKIDRASKFKIGSYGLLGDRFVDVIPPPESSGEFIEHGEVLKGTEAKGLGEIAERLESISANIQEKLLTEDLTADVHEMVKNGKNLLGRMDQFMSEAEAGKGPLYTLMKDEKVAQDIKVTVAEMKQLSINLRSRGVLFYKDMSQDEKVEEAKNKTNKASVTKKK